MFFNLLYKKTNLYHLDLPLYFVDYYIYFNHFSRTFENFKVLEAIVLSTLFDIFRFFNILFGTVSYVILNNFSLLYILALFFIVKLVELGLLYD